ncbi:MAG: RNase J family beta-CASP ribonuclease [Candidatus Magasanikbacteria bacterium]|nr:RNase J family beta-CASP ribonuclease [Candidatus Magasanikbacteria bacterium]
MQKTSNITRNSGRKSHQKRSSNSKRRPGSSRKTNKKRSNKKRRSHVQGKKSGQKVNGSPLYKKGVLRIIPLGGCEEVGRNMTVFEYEGDIVILDMGLQFPEEDMPGIDFIIPNVKYLESKSKKIRGVIFSHGHLDHIGAAPILLEKLGNPPIIGRDLTLALVKHKQEDYKKNSSKKLKTIRIEKISDVIKLGKFKIKFFQVEHSIMDAVGVIVETPGGIAIHPGDWTLERDKRGKPTVDYKHLRKLKKPTVLMLESLGAVNEKAHGSYEEMYKNLLNIISKSPGRVIIGTFSSQIERIKWILQVAQKLGKKVALDGYSMKMNVEIAKKLGYLKIKKGQLVDIRKIDKYPDKKVIVIGTGAQGEENAVLMRIVNGQHKYIKLKKQDTVIFSSSVIPGNERSIQRLKDNIYRQCDRVIHGEVMDVHVSGHATRADIWEMIRQIKPTYFVPVYANHYMLKEAAWLARDNGFREDKIFVPDNGSVIEISKKDGKVLQNKVPSDYVFVDGLGVTDTQNIVLRDRQVLAEDGMVVVIATLDTKTGKLVQNPDIISRGFVFLKENKQLIEDLRHKVKKMVIESDPLTWADTNQIKNDIRDKVGQFLFSKTQKRPMVLPVVIEV